MIEGRVFQAKGKGMVGPKFWVCLVFSWLFLGLSPITATAAINEQLQFSGELVTTNKTSVSNGNYNFKFELYNGSTGGSAVWAETYDANNGRVSVTDGLFSVSLGSHTTLNGVDFDNSSLYLQVYYDPGNDGTYEESFVTRIRLTAAPYAFNSTKLGGKTESTFGTLSENELVSGNWQFNDQLRFGDDDFSNYVGFQAPSTVTSNLVWTLPAADGSSGQFLKTNGSGALAWATASSALTGLSDVTISTVGNNEMLAYDTATSKWINQTAAEAGLAPAGDYITALTGGVTASGPGAAVATVITNANLTGPITSVGNTTAVASQTGTGSTFVMDTSPTLVTPALGAATYTTLVGGNITDSGLMAGRVTYAGAAGILQDSANMTFDTTNGLILAAGSTSALQLSSTAGTAVGGLLFGTDTNLYRSGANVLKTDDSLVVGGASADLLAQGDLRFYDSDSSNYVGLQAPAIVGTNLVWTLPSVDGGSGQCLSTNAAGTLSWSDCVSSAGAPTTAQYITLALDATLSAERVLTGTANQIILADGGANGNIVLSLPQNIALTSSPTFAGLALGTGSLTMTGSLGATGARLTKGWFTDLEVTNAIVGSVTGSSGSTTGNAATVTNGVYTTDTGTVTSTMIFNGTIATADIASGAVTALKLQSAAADLGAADVTVNFGNTNAAFNTNITTDGTITATAFTIGANSLDTNEWANLDGTNQTLATTSSPQFAGLTLTGTAALDGGITVDTNNFTVSGSTGAVGIVAAQTTGTTLGVSYDVGTQTGALTGLAVDFTNITTDATNALYGIKLDDAVSNTASIEYGIYQAGTNWDYGAYFDDLVRIADSGLVLGSTAVTSTAAELNILDGATLTVTELNYLDGTVVTAGGVIFGNGTYLANTGAGNTGELLTSAGAGTPTWTAQSSVNAGQIDSLDSADFLRATASDTYEGSNDRTLTIQSALTAAARTTNLVTISQANDATFNQTAGVLLNISQADTGSSTNGVYIQNAGTGYALAFEQGTTTADGIVWGADANLVTLYRSANDTLKTDDSLVVGDALNVTGTTTLAASLTGLLKATAGVVSVASAGTDYLATGGTLFTLAGTTGDNQTISQGNTLTIAAGTDITTTGGATDTVTIANSSTLATVTGRGATTTTLVNLDGGIAVDTSNFTVSGSTGATAVAAVNSAGGSLNALTLSGTLGIFDGTDTFRGLYLNYTNSDHTSTSNVFNGIDIANITGDAEATETAINIGTGWDYGLTAPAGGTAAIYLSDTGGTTAGGLQFGTETTLHRSSAGQLIIDPAASNPAGLTLQGLVSSAVGGSAVKLNFARRSGTTPIIINSADQLGTVTFSGYDGAAYQTAASIQGLVDTTPGTNDMPGRLVFSTTADGATTLTEAMRIDSAQKMWIGSGAGLDTNLYRSAADTLYTDDSFTVGANFIAAGTSALQGATTESKVNAASGSADALTLSGTLGIFNGSDTFRGLYLNYTNVNHTGATNNFYGIDIAGITADADASEYAVNIGSGWDAAINFANTAGNVDFRSAKADTAGTSQFLFNTSATVSSATLFAVQNNGTNKFQISAAGTITDLQTYSDTVGATNRDLFVDDTGKFGYVSSSIRYKENVKTLNNNDTNWLYNLRPVTFDYIDPTKGVHQIGLIAEDVAQVYPELVSYSADDPTLPETVSYSKMVVPLLNAVQGLHTSLEDVSQQVQNMSADLTNLQTAIGDALATNTLTTSNINTSSGDLVLTAASGKIRVTSSLEVDGQVILHNDLKVDGEIAGASIDLGDQTSGHGTILKTESEVFINSQVVKADDKIVLTPTYNSSLIGNNVQLFKGEVTDNIGFKVKSIIAKPLTEKLEFDWLIVK